MTNTVTHYAMHNTQYTIHLHTSNKSINKQIRQFTK